MAAMDAAQIEAFLHLKIPLTRAMRLTVAGWDGSTLTLAAPLEANVNHLGTGFGGSLFSLATLAAYGMLRILLDEFHAEARIVIRDSSVRYRRPITTDFQAVCRRPDEATVAAFRDAMTQYRKARIELAVTIDEAGERAVDFSGTFVALG